MKIDTNQILIEILKDDLKYQCWRCIFKCEWWYVRILPKDKTGIESWECRCKNGKVKLDNDEEFNLRNPR